jgi:3-oxoacyl-[acyl-carrier protein] reductase
MLLEAKTAVIYGGGGSIGGAVARAFGREGATVFLAGRTLEKLETVAEDMRAGGGTVEIAEVDALDEKAVDEHADAIASQAGGIDISFNLITHPANHGTPLAEMALDDFMEPIEAAVRSTFITTRAGARHMIPRRLGVFLAFACRASARLLHRGHAGRLRRDRDAAPPALRRAGPARDPLRNPGERRSPRDAPRGLRRP